jgi:acetylornithine deacetylase
VRGGGAHADTEWAEIASIHQLTEILDATIAEFAG